MLSLFYSVFFKCVQEPNRKPISSQNKERKRSLNNVFWHIPVKRITLGDKNLFQTCKQQNSCL